MVDGDCYVKITCNQCEVQGPSYILFILKEDKSYASSIQFNVTASSSIPEQISSINITINPDELMIFRGPEPTIFEVLTIPSAYETNNPKQINHNGNTGYHVMSTGYVDKGTQYPSSEMQFTSNLYAKISLKPSESSLMTRQTLKSSYVNLFSTVLGSIFGIMGIVGKLMSFVEKNKNQIKAKNNYKSKLSKQEYKHLCQQINLLKDQFEVKASKQVKTKRKFSIKKARQRFKQRIKISQISQSFPIEELYESYTESPSLLQQNIQDLKQENQKKCRIKSNGYIDLLALQKSSQVIPSASEENQLNQMRPKQIYVYNQENEKIQSKITL